MRSKSVLTILLVICMVFSCLTPVAAVTAGSETRAAAEVKESVSSESAPSDEARETATLRDTQEYVMGSKDGVINDTDAVAAEGSWKAELSETEVSVDLRASVPSCVEELRELASQYSKGEKVIAFVVLEQEPLSKAYKNIADVPANVVSSVESVQARIAQAIENTVLGGDFLDIICQFNYLTNALVIETEIENLEQIAYVEGVKTVFINPVFYPCDEEALTVSSGQMTGVSSVWNTESLGYTGEGMTIAILDTGLDLDHPSFAADPAGALWSEQDVAELLSSLELNAEDLYTMSSGGTLTAADLYYSAKVPFIFNYAMGSTNVGHNDGIGDHGTHVAGIAAANAVEGTGVVGMAPDAQIIVMKVFNSTTGGANMYDILNALEDCMRLGVDVANLSLGSSGGFSASGVDVIDDIYANIKNTDLIVDIAAGNEGTSAYGSLWGNYMNTTENIDTATVSSPSTYANALSIASVENSFVMGSYFTLSDGSEVFYQPSVEYLYEYTDIGMEDLAGQDLEYVIVPGLGEVADFEDLDLTGKVAVVSRGSISFAEKIANAVEAGACAVLIWNNVSEDIYAFGMSTEDEYGMYPVVPVALISLEDGEKMAAAETKTMNVSTEDGLRIEANGGQMSTFSSWGVAPDLSLVPDLAGVGGNVYSCYDGGKYGLMSGTSMATPQVAGVTALVLQYLQEKFPNASISEIRTLVDGLMMSTAIPVIDSATGLEASPRQQGAGLVNALAAVTAEAYLSVDGNDRPKAELGDSAAGTYSFSFTVHNFGTADKTYTLGSSLLCEDYTTDEAYPGVYFIAEQDRALSGAVSFSSATVTVPAGGSASVTVSIALSDADKTWIDTYFPNGNYVEGFVYLYDNAEEGGVDLSLPFLGFYKDWAAAPVFDTGFWYENSFWEGVIDVDLSNVDGEQYWTVPWTTLGGSSTDWVLGFNPYTGAMAGEDGNVIYSSKNNVISPNGDGLLDYISDYYVSMMRNARWLYLTYTDAEGNVLDVEELDYITKTMFMSNYGATVPFVYSWYYDSLYDFTDENGEYLPDGTELTLTFTAMLDGEDEISADSFSIPVYVDTQAPVIELDPVEFSKDGKNYMTLTVNEPHLAYVAVMNSTGTQVYGEYADADFTDNGNGTVSVTVDVTSIGDNFMVALGDYGINEAYYDLTWTAGGNNPEVDETALYAYQVYDEYLYYYYGWDYMFGWTTVDKETAAVEMLQSDMYEYYAITAAEYVDGYIFAFDAGGEFLYMTPGLWTRNPICATGLNVIDMAWDDATGTMYLVTSDSENYSYCLYTIDLLTGELTYLWDYYSQYSMPWAMTFVDGELYCCKFYYNGFYKVDLESGMYDLVAVTLEDGSNFVPQNASGGNASPRYAQSMTYSEADGLIYWLYYSGSACELITIDPSTWTSTAVPMDWDREYVGVLTLDETSYQIPESEAATKLVISDDMIVLGTGETYDLTVSVLPWNAPAGEITWASDDESIATVDENGTVTAVSEGVAYISATCGDLYAECTVNVVDISGTLHAYDYYSGDGDLGAWLSIDLATMTETADSYSPVDFIAADYNGHNGKTYGYDQFGQLYSYDAATGDCVAIGASTSKVFADMAYDYSTGLMYAITYDYNTWTTTLYNVDMNSGKLVEVAQAYDVFLTLACDMYGFLYGINTYGEMYMLFVMEGEAGGIGGWEPWSTEDGETSYYIETSYVMQTPVHELFYAQSMCYDHNNDVILWVNPETSSIYWLDIMAWDPYAINLGDSSNSGLIEYMGLHVIPNEIPELPEVAPESIEGEDMLLLVGQSKLPAVSVAPVNTNLEYSVSYAVADESVASLQDGYLVGLTEGSTSVTATLTCGDMTMECSFNVVVKNSTGSLYAYLMQDMANYNGYCWIEIPDTDPLNYYGLDYVYYNGSYMTLYAAEYVDGYIYAYGYDDTDWEANFQFMVIDPVTWGVVSGVDMGDEFPFVYDMAFDYTTGAMYALAGSSTATDLYYVNLTNGQLVECLLTDPMFLSLAVGADGTIYAMEQSAEEFDWMTWESTYTPAMMYTIDIEAGTWDVFMDTGIISNMVTSMTYDYDTGYIYWASLSSSSKGALNLIDLDERAVYELGTIGASASEVTGLISFADEYPAIPEEISKLALTSTMEEIAVGDTVALEAFILPATADAEMTWTSSDESIATVDENGVVTGVSAGTCTVTVTIVDGDNTFTATCTIVVYGEDGYFITYNWTDGGFAHIARPDPSTVVNQTEGETDPLVRAMAMVNGYIFGYDENGDLFVTTEDDGFVREYIGNCGIEVAESYDEVFASYSYHYDYTFTVRDMTWDDANDRLLALGSYGVVSTYSANDGSYDYTEEYELDGGCRLYEVDMATGALTELCVVGGEDMAESGVYMFTVIDDGRAFVYSTFMDWVSEIDLTTGYVTNLSTLQNQGVYGSTDGEPMAMTYDSVTNTIYMLFTGNGNFYQMFTFNVGTGALSKVNNIGEVVYNPDLWANMGDMFAGLLVNEDHVCEYETVIVEATCTEDGYEKNECPLCGYEKVLPAHGHEYELSEDGATYVCIYCGDSYKVVEVLPGAPEKPEKPEDPDQPDTPDQPDQPDTPVEPEWPFVDVDEDDWFYGAVSYVYSEGLMNGISEDTFAPYGNVSRAMVVVTLYRMAGSPEVTGTNSFTDLTASWYKDAVQWAVETGVTTGRSETIFDPDANVTREELAAFICRYAEYCGYDTSASADLSVYTDADQIGAWAKAYMSWANAEGLITGRTETTLVPKGTANRAELATILMRFCENIAE